MFLAGVLCMCAAAASALFGSWSLCHTPTADPTALALRAMAPTQLAAAVMLAAGGVVAVAAPGHTALMVVIVCIAGAVGTLAAGSWQSAQYALRRETASPTANCVGSCAVCTQACLWPTRLGRIAWLDRGDATRCSGKLGGGVA